MYGSLDLRFFETSSGRRPVQDFLDGLPTHLRAQVMADAHLVALHGRMAPVSVKAIRGARNRGLWEMEIMWLLHACRKQDQVARIDVARERMRRVA